MDPDLLLVIGLVIGILALPSLLAAFSESRAPRAGAILILVAGVLVVLAVLNKGDGYTIEGIPDVFYKVIGRYIN